MGFPHRVIIISCCLDIITLQVHTIVVLLLGEVAGSNGGMRGVGKVARPRGKPDVGWRLRATGMLVLWNLAPCSVSFLMGSQDLGLNQTYNTFCMTLVSS